jgi:hypothetical protein
MRADLLDAKAALDWANTQIPLLQQSFIEWVRANPYHVTKEPHLDGGGDAAVVYDQPFPLTFNAWVGAIINSLRSSLDLIAAALATRNGANPSADTHFPIFRCLHDFIDPLTGIESKKWLSKSEVATIKSFKPYDGGDDSLWPLHRLDVLRKHQRLIRATPDISGHLMISDRMMRVGGSRAIERTENKTILRRMAPGELLHPPQGHTYVAVFITFNEVALELANEEVATVLRRFEMRVTDVLYEIDRL